MTKVVTALLGFGARRALPAREAYALWAGSYPPVPHNPLMQTEQAIVAPIIRSTSPRRALDVGTGSGRYLPLLVATGARVVVGVDFSLPMLRAGCSGADGRPGPADAGGADVSAAGTVPRVCGDACRLPFRDATFDLVSSSLMVGDVADLARWVGEVARVTAPGGHLVYSDFHPSWATGRWRRTFQTADGRSFEVAYFPHTIAEHLRVLADRSFDVRAIREPRLEARNGAARLARIGRRPAPVVVVFHAVKRGPGRPRVAAIRE